MQPVRKPKFDFGSGFANPQYVSQHTDSIHHMLKTMSRVHLIDTVVLKWDRLCFQIYFDVCDLKDIQVYEPPTARG